MAMDAVTGNMGDGKTFTVVNVFLADALQNTNRPVYVNLPCDGDQLDYFLAWCFKRPSNREAARARLHFLEPGEAEAFEEYYVDVSWKTKDGEVLPRDAWPRNVERALARGFQRIERPMPWPESEFQVSEYRREGVELRRRSLGMKDRVAEFWYFTEPNAFVILDETADLFNSLASADKGQKDKRRVLQSYINHHRHYKDDLLFLMQATDDLDVQVRRKMRYIYVCENQKNVPMFKHWAFRGLRWPVQHFLVRQFQARKVLGKGMDYDKFEFVNQFRVWPTRRKFKNYRSFSAAQMKGLGGKRGASESALSQDMDTPWQRVRQFFVNAANPLSVLVFLAVSIYFGLRMIYGLAGITSDDVSKQLTGGKTNAVVKAEAMDVAAVNPGSSATIEKTVSGTNALPPAPEKLRLIVANGFKTDSRWYRVGDDFPGRGAIKRVYRDGVEFADGAGYTFDFLLSGGRHPGK